MVLQPRHVLIPLFTTWHSRQVACSAVPAAAERMLQLQSWAVVGDVLHTSKAAGRCAEALRQAGREVQCVNPRDRTGTLAKSLLDLEAPVDAIDLVINSRDGLKQMQHAKELGIGNVWIQPGAASAEILAFCEESSIEVHEGCVLIDLPRLRSRL